MIHARYTQICLAAQQWEALAAFYQHVFGCVPMVLEHEYPEQALASDHDLSPRPCLGIHLRLPGYGAHGPVLAIYHNPDHVPGDGHITTKPHLVFAVADVTQAQLAIEAAGGQRLSSASVQILSNGIHLTCGFVGDPEGNIIELQNWAYQPTRLVAESSPSAAA